MPSSPIHGYSNMNRPSLLRRIVIGILALLTLASTGPAADAPDSAAVTQSTAVALNYCRAAFHRIRKEPSKVVLLQEQEKILNNLNLGQVVDPEVIQLYTAVLDEINQIGIAEHERTLLHASYSGNLQRKVAWDALAFSTELATMQVGTAIKTGANSWWDYRNQTLQRDLEVLKVDKARMTAVVTKSSQFLDTFWKLAQRRNIPDRWLVRGDDLDTLDQALRQTDPNTRQRVLKRMEPFLSKYPPYWYYVARTAQEQGQLASAASLYENLRVLGDGHFRKDDMLATALANRAAIQEQLAQTHPSDTGQDTEKAAAVATARQALAYSTDSWEANLLCARVLQRHKKYDDAEDAILRNLDVGLEKPQSRVYLASLYYHSENREKLVKMLNDNETVAQLPAPVLLRCSAWLKETPTSVARTVRQTLEGQPRFLIGADEFLLTASPNWQLHLADIKLMYEGQQLTKIGSTVVNGRNQIRYGSKSDWGSPFSPGTKLKFSLSLTYPDKTSLQMTLQSPHNHDLSAASPAHMASARITPTAFVITNLTVGAARVAVDLGSEPPEKIDAESVPLIPPAVKSAEVAPSPPTKTASTAEE